MMAQATPAPHAAGDTHGYTIEAADPATHREALLAVWRQGLEQHGRPEAKFDWYYRRHPGGTPRVFLLRHAGAAGPVGTATLATRVMYAGGERLEGGFLSDFVVAPEHRGFFPALFLQREVRRHGLQAHPVVFGLPNPKSAAVVKRVGYEVLGEAVRYARVLHSTEYLSRYVPHALAALAAAVVDPVLMRRGALARRRLRRFRAEWLEAPDARFDALFERCRARGWLMGERTRRYLAWRFADYPFARHGILALVDEADGALAAYAVCREEGEALDVRDFLVDPGRADAAASLWHRVAREAYRTGFRSVSVKCLAPPEVGAQLHAAGFVPRQRQQVIAARAAGVTAAPWFITPADEDV